MSLSDAQDWAVRQIAARGGPITATRVGKLMLDRPGLDTTGKTYSQYTLGRMGGGMIANLKKSGMVRSRKIRGITVCALTRAGRRYTRPEQDQHMPEDLAAFMEMFL